MRFLQMRCFFLMRAVRRFLVFYTRIQRILSMNARFITEVVTEIYRHLTLNGRLLADNCCFLTVNHPLLAASFFCSYGKSPSIDWLFLMHFSVNVLFTLLIYPLVQIIRNQYDNA